MTIQVATEEEADLKESIDGDERHYKQILGIRPTLEDTLNARDFVTDGYSDPETGQTHMMSMLMKILWKELAPG